MFDTKGQAEFSAKFKEMMDRQFAGYDSVSATVKRIFAESLTAAKSAELDAAFEKVKETMIENRTALDTILKPEKPTYNA